MLRKSECANVLLQLTHLLQEFHVLLQFRHVLLLLLSKEVIDVPSDRRGLGLQFRRDARDRVDLLLLFLLRVLDDVCLCGELGFEFHDLAVLRVDLLLLFLHRREHLAQEILVEVHRLAEVREFPVVDRRSHTTTIRVQLVDEASEVPALEVRRLEVPLVRLEGVAGATVEVEDSHLSLKLWR